MSHKKMMKAASNPRKYRKPQPMLFHVEGGFEGEKSLWHRDNRLECPKCKYMRPRLFFDDDLCDMCNSGRPLKEAHRLAIHGKVESVEEERERYRILAVDEPITIIE